MSFWELTCCVDLHEQFLLHKINGKSFHFQALDEFATKLIQNNHYAMDDVATRRDAVSI